MPCTLVSLPLPKTANMLWWLRYWTRRGEIQIQVLLKAKKPAGDPGAVTPYKLKSALDCYKPVETHPHKRVRMS